MSLSFRLALFAAASASAVAASAAPPYQHVLVLSVDGLHAADLTDPATAAYLPDVLGLASHGITYANAHAVKPTDNFPNVVAQFTGAGPKTSGIYYDDTYRRDYYGAGASLPTSPAGTSADWTADIDRDQTLINGGGNADVTSIDPLVLPKRNVGGVLTSVYPNQDLKVNTVFEVAHAAGLRTAYIDKHPAYEIVAGPSGLGLDDFYGPESDAKAKIVNGVLLDRSSFGGSTKGLKQISKDITLSQAYDDMRVSALINQINGQTSRGAPAPGAPALFGLSFIAVNTAEKDTASGGLDNFGNGTIVNAGLASALGHVNDSVRGVVDALKSANLYNSTLIVLTSKHGQGPRVGTSTVEPAGLAYDALTSAGIAVKQTTDDDVSLVWLADSGQAAAAKAQLLASNGSVIQDVLIGSQLTAAGLGDPSTDPRAPDLIVQYKPGVLLSSSAKRSEHGGFSDDDASIAMILAGGGIPADLQGTTQFGSVLDTQLAPTMLEALGLDPSQLQGAVLDGTGDLPGSGLSVPEPVAATLLIPLAAYAATRRRRRGAGGAGRNERQRQNARASLSAP